MGAVRIGLALALLALDGCCLTAVTGVDEHSPNPSSGGSTAGAGATSGAASSTGEGTTTSGAASSTSTGSATGGTTSAGGTTAGTSGTTTGSTIGPCGPASDLQTHVTYPLFASVFLTSADLNGDGLLDLIANSTGGPDSGFDVLFGLPDGGLSDPVFYPGSDGTAIAVGDLNGDGRPDVAATNGLSIDLYTSDENGGLTAIPALNLPLNAHAIAIADFNADGLGDLLVAEGNEDSLQIYFAFPDGGFSGPNAATGSDEWFAGFVVEDLNQDGLPDIAAVSSSAGPEAILLVLLNQKNGGFQASRYGTDTSYAGQLALLPNVGAAPDLVLGSNAGSIPGAVHVFKNSGSGAFSVGPTYSTAGGPWLAVGDFNGDCIPDVATTYSLNCAPGFGISALYGDAAGGFGPAVSLPASGTAHSPAGVAVLGPVGHPNAFAVADDCKGGLTVYGNPGKPE